MDEEPGAWVKVLTLVQLTVHYDSEMYTTLCTVRCTPAASSWQAAVGPKGSYRRQDFQVILQLGLTEMKAQVGWEEDVRIQCVLYRLVFTALSSEQGVQRR